MKRKIVVFFGALAFFALCAIVFIEFLAYHQEKVVASGIEFNDVILGLLPAMDISEFIFSITYGSVFLYIVSNTRKIEFLSQFAFAGGLIQLLRMISMTLVPLKEPVDMIKLEDPFLNNVIYPGEITTDLFFSGHTAFVMVMFFISRKYLYLGLAIVLGFTLMIQRAHYSIDIIGAVPIAYIVSIGVGWLSDKLHGVKEST